MDWTPVLSLWSATTAQTVENRARYRRLGSFADADLIGFLNVDGIDGDSVASVVLLWNPHIVPARALGFATDPVRSESASQHRP